MNQERPRKSPVLSEEQIQQHVSSGIDRGAAVALSAVIRRAAVSRAKLRSNARALTRAQKAPRKAPAHKLHALVLRRKQHEASVRRAEADVGLLTTRSTLEWLPGRAGAYGRIIDEADGGVSGVAVQIVAADGKSVAKVKSDAEGYFSIRAPDGVQGELLLQVETDKGVTEMPLTKSGTALPARVVILRVAGKPPKSKRESVKPSSKPAPSKPAPSKPAPSKRKG